MDNNRETGSDIEATRPMLWYNPYWCRALIRCCNNTVYKIVIQAQNTMDAKLIIHLQQVFVNVF